MNKFKVYCGPTLVNSLADLLTRHGVMITLLGTQHVYGMSSLTFPELLALLNQVMSGFKRGDIEYLGSTQPDMV